MMAGNINQIRSARESVINKTGLIKLISMVGASGALMNQIEKDMQELNQIKKELAVMEEKQLRIHKRGNRYEFACRSKDTGRDIGITGDTKLIHQLARRAIIANREKTVAVRLRRLQAIVDSCEEIRSEAQLVKKLNRYSSAGLDLCRVLFTKEQNEWIDQRYTPNPFHPENLRYTTNGNMYMRSMSETRIGNHAELLGLPYRYDDLVLIYDPKRGGYSSREDGPFRESYFADFKFPNLLGGITVHEHLGAFQIDSYGDNSLKRLNDYHNFQILELDGRPVRYEEITWSFENDVRDTKALEQLFLKVLLPGVF